jgi:hypothetical protein
MRCCCFECVVDGERMRLMRGILRMLMLMLVVIAAFLILSLASLYGFISFCQHNER